MPPSFLQLRRQPPRQPASPRHAAGLGYFQTSFLRCWFVRSKSKLLMATASDQGRNNSFDEGVSGYLLVLCARAPKERFPKATTIHNRTKRMSKANTMQPKGCHDEPRDFPKHSCGVGSKKVGKWSAAWMLRTNANHV